MENKPPISIKSIGAFHKLRGLPPPEHPLISVVDYAKMKVPDTDESSGLLFDFYLISVKKGLDGKLKYGQQTYDHDNGVMSFMAPHQLLKIERQTNTDTVRSGWMLLIHPDFIWNTPLATHIRRYDYFGYAANEALFLSEKEEAALNHLVGSIREEYQNNIDRFSQNIIIAQIETLLNYAERFYQRQFITRQKSSHQLLERLSVCLEGYFTGNAPATKGLPTVQSIAEQLHVSTGYLGALLKSLTGMNTQQHIHEKLVERAKEKLSTTTLSVGEIAYELGFEHSQSFSKFFKKKTNFSPLEFRQSFN